MDTKAVVPLPAPEPVEVIADEVRFQRALAVVQHQVKCGSTVAEACEACHVPVRTFYDWLKAGVLAEYIADCRESRSEATKALAAEALPGVMQYMVRIATGKVVVRGANPIAAAQFVFAAAGEKDPSAAEGKATTNVLAFLPQMLTLQIQPVAESPSASEPPIEAEYEEVESGQN